MKTIMPIMLGIFLVLSIGFVLAEKPADAGSAPDNANVTKNMTFGQCVTEAAKIKNTCFGNALTNRENCANNSDNPAKTKQCRNDYKKEKKQCKAEFKSAKKTCIQKTKPKLWEKIRYGLS